MSSGQPRTPPPSQSPSLLLVNNPPTSHRRTKSLQVFPNPTAHMQHQEDKRSFKADDEISLKSAPLFLDIRSNGQSVDDTHSLPLPLSTTLKQQNTSANDVSCTKIFIYTSIAISAVCVFIFLGFDYIKYVLLSLEQASLSTSLFVFFLLFTAVSFPMTWGYILLNVAVGYLYGVLKGVPMVMTCAILGVTTAHHVIRRCFKDFVRDRLSNDTMRSILAVVDSDNGVKVVALARLTPIPFGLQNALFAVSNIPVGRYLAASMLGMLPSQGLHVYIGSTLRSMEEVVSANRSSSLAYCIFAAQFLVAILLLVFVLNKARAEFDRTLEEVKVIRDGLTPTSSTGSEASCGGSSSLLYSDLMSDRLSLHRKPTYSFK